MRFRLGTMERIGAVWPSATGFVLGAGLVLASGGCSPPDAGSPGRDGAPRSPDRTATVTVVQDTLMGSRVLRVAAHGLPPSVRAEVGMGPPASEFDVVTAARSGPDGTLSVLLPVPAWFEGSRPYVAVVDVADRGVRAVSDPFRATRDGPLVALSGRLTDTGGRCLELQGRQETRYALTGALDGFGDGDRVAVVAAPAEAADCGDALTLRVTDIRVHPPRDPVQEARRR